MRYLILILTFLLMNTALRADTFFVISKNDAGAGSLRDAIERANNNGTTDLDYIYFNLPGSSLADVTIALETELPVLSSNIILDATTQPFSALGNPNIKVSLIRVVAAYFSGIRLDNASRVAVYGLLFSNFQSDPLGALDDKKAGIYLYNSKDIVIGAPNKPNCFVGCYAGILSPFVIPKFFIENIKISSNIFGLSENGLNLSPNESGIDISFLKNSIIGGDSADEGNLITGNTRSGIALGGAESNIKISNNIIGLDKNFMPKPTTSANGIYVNGGNSMPIISDNFLAGQAKGIYIDFVNDGFIIARNKIGTGKLGTENFSNTLGIHINFSNTKGLIGGSNINDQNTIGYNKTAILIENSYPISIYKNSIYCNTFDAVTFKNQSLNQAKIDVITTTEVSGKYIPNATVELFYTDDCNDCQGKTWFATLRTHADGSWKYTGTVTGKVTSLGTDENGATSNFSKPLINDTEKQIIDPFCGESTGSIKNLHVYNSSVYQWYNAAGAIVGNKIDLENVSAGTYYLKAGQRGLCDVTSATFTIGPIGNGISDANRIVTNESCGGANGSIKNIAVANDLSRTWYNLEGQVVGRGVNLENVPAGGYFFKVGTGTCEITSPIYEIKNLNKDFSVRSVLIAPATCDKQNGSITIQSYQGERPIVFTWKDSQGNVVGNNENLSQVLPGSYTLLASDGVKCESIAGTFKVEASQLPEINVNQIEARIGCDGANISVSGIQVTGSNLPYVYAWVDANEQTISTSLNLMAKPGRYYLKVKDSFGCEVRTDFLDFNALADKKIQVPNSITPNGDGVNDTWRIKGIENYPNAEFYVFNRNGDQLFYSLGYNKEFDGKFNGKPLGTGVYYYLIDLKTDCGKISGSLTILN
ncbi:gliding motility-associated C-terminal domain-containing protein [Pedobacter sandarakinus]|uniref:gliding motility-associated C-terminal domain-containing protein n=1 Tax=Pedobacter sandarakinus TaxID=353156 RepID=UPI002246A8B6|nr:gliding motility-associated C-terminal domain-containing protein [Pedobacter sandarakinus]MCX2573559.1 gliding motility-associated C-terminal domain-containing protein [Pedobacter sandarakinus]